ncbi:glycoside hydrolase family 25 protein [Nocardioides sp. SYSU DS0651]|uniref:glycoside hydrolase family 25 protein n=1 Tax=Nocardioides sp. SYSU DS0651 TaxID=3415955 RepID=UPI003F4BEE8D
MRTSVPALVAVVVLVAAGAVSGCGGDGTPKDGVPASTSTPPRSATGEESGASGPATGPPVSRAPRPSRSTDPTTGPTADPTTGPLRGIDASHHQGAIDWRRVARHGIAFAYLKATEGTGFTDPRFAENRRAALREGIRVGGYHYFQLCSDGAAQAAHFIAVLGDNAGRRGLPPAIDLELAGSCATPPDRAALLAEVRSFLDAVEERFGTRPVVYLYPELEERYSFARALSAYPQWVRRLGDRPPRREWHLWQYDDRASVPGINGPADLNLMRR